MYTHTLTVGDVIISIIANTPKQIIDTASTLDVKLHYSYSKKEFEILSDVQYNHLCNIITNELDAITNCEQLYEFVNKNPYYIEFSSRKDVEAEYEELFEI
jgi:hypothetical protein